MTLPTTLSDASYYLHRLYQIERAYALDEDLSALLALIDGIDPIDLMNTANVLRTMAVSCRELPHSRAVPTETLSLPPSEEDDRVSATAIPPPEQSTARVIFLHEPPVFPGWSVRVG